MPRSAEVQIGKQYKLYREPHEIEYVRGGQLPHDSLTPQLNKPVKISAYG